MSHSTAAGGQPQEEPHRLPRQQETDQNNTSNLNTATRQPEQQPSQSPEQQAEIERIGRLELYVGLQRDADLFSRLNYWRDLKLCARVTTVDRLGLSQALDYYTKLHVKRRGDLLQVPATTAYVEVEQHGSATDLFLLILEFLSHPLSCGPLRDLRSRTWGTLKAYGVKILIINNADLLSFPAFNELVRIFEKLRISIVLAGPSYLNDILNPNSQKKRRYVNIYNTFLKYHEFSLLSPADTATIIQEWEKSGLRWSQPLNLAKDTTIVKTIHEASQGQLRPLYENLREIAVWSLAHSNAQVNSQNISKALGSQYQPISKCKPV